MSLTHKTTLLDEADVAAVKTYIATMLNSHRDGGKKREVLAYLKRLIVTDRDTLTIQQAKHRAATDLIKTHSQRAELTHELEIQHLMTADARAVNVLIELLQEDAGVLFGVDYTFDNTVFGPLMSSETRFVIQGDDARFFGESNGGSAILQTLACSCIVKAPLHLKPKSGATEIEDVIIDGVEFVPNSAQDCVTFETKVVNLTFTNCIFDGKNNAPSGSDPGSQCLYGEGEALEGVLTLKNCIIKNFKSWLLMDPTTSSSATPSTRLSLVDIQDCLFLNNRGSMAFRTVDDPSGAGYAALPNSGLITFKFVNNTFDVSGLADVHPLFWSSVECNNFEKVIVTGNTANCYRDEAVGGDRGFLQVWSKLPEMIFEIENNKLTDFNIAYQFAFGGEPANAAIWYGCTNANSYVKIGQNDLTRVDFTHKLVYPWLSSTAIVNLVDGVLPTITFPSALSTADLTGSLIETFAASSLEDIIDHTFELGNNTSGYIQVTPTAEILTNSNGRGDGWFIINVHSTIAQVVTLFWQDQMVLPDGATWRFIEQERSWNAGLMSKRNHMDSSFTSCPANAAFVFKLYFRID